MRTLWFLIGLVMMEWGAFGAAFQGSVVASNDTGRLVVPTNFFQANIIAGSNMLFEITNKTGLIIHSTAVGGSGGSATNAQPPSENLTNWSNVATGAVAIAAVTQPASANLTNWSGTATGGWATVGFVQTSTNGFVDRSITNGFIGKSDNITGNAAGATNYYGPQTGSGSIVASNAPTITSPTLIGTANLAGAIRAWDGSLLATNMTARTNGAGSEALTTYGGITANGKISANGAVQLSQELDLASDTLWTNQSKTHYLLTNATLGSFIAWIPGIGLVKSNTITGAATLLVGTNGGAHYGSWTPAGAGNVIADGTITASNHIGLATGLTNASGGALVSVAAGANITMTTNAGVVTVAGSGGSTLVYDASTNAFSGTTFSLGTNSFISTATNIYLIDVLNLPTTTERWGQLTIQATADISITNAPTIKASDQVVSRIVPSGSYCVISMDVQAGLYTNMAIVQFK